MNADDIKRQLERHVRMAGPSPLTLEVVSVGDDHFRIELHDHIAHAIMRPHSDDIARWDDHQYNYYAYHLITEWAVQRYLIEMP